MQLHFGKRKQRLIKKTRKTFSLGKARLHELLPRECSSQTIFGSFRGVGFALSFLRCLGSIRDVSERGRGFALSGLL